MTNTTITFVGPEAAADKLDAIKARRPGLAERAATIADQMQAADRLYADNLAAIRHAAALTQAQLATQMGVEQPEISRLETRPDMLLSTLTGYLTAVGERPRVVVTIGGQDIELDLTALTAGQNRTPSA